MTVPPLSLDRVPTGTMTVVSEVDGPHPLVRRLAELGLRPGATVTPRHRTAGGGRVVEVAGSRIALAKSVLAAIATETHG